MVNYTNGKVYKIEPTVEMLDEGDIYIGSSAKEYLSQRMDTHRRDYKQWKKGNASYTKMSSYNLFDKYGVDNCKITLLEVCSCNSRDELIARESHYIRTMKCVNKIVPDRKMKEWKEDNKEHIAIQSKEWNAKNQKINFECECGAIFSRAGIARHLRTKNHLKFVAENKSTEEDLSLVES
jgi:ribosome-interacting GTPase 1